MNKYCNSQCLLSKSGGQQSTADGLGCIQLANEPEVICHESGHVVVCAGLYERRFHTMCSGSNILQADERSVVAWVCGLMSRQAGLVVAGFVACAGWHTAHQRFWRTAAAEAGLQATNANPTVQ